VVAEGLTETFRDGQISRHIMGRKPLKPTGPMTAAERQARRRKRVGKSINHQARRRYKLKKESAGREATRLRLEASRYARPIEEGFKLHIGDCRIAGQPAAVVTRSGIPIVYQGQQFPSRKALAEHLAPLLGRSVAALEVALRSHNDNIERVVGGLVKPSSGKAIPITYQGQQFPNRAALAKHLAPLVGKTRSSLITLLSRYNGDVERALASRRRPITFEGQAFPHRKALAEYLAPRLHRPARSVEALLINYNDDVEAVLLARPYRQRPRRFAGRRAG
jgi:hypothetical protein